MLRAAMLVLMLAAAPSAKAQDDAGANADILGAWSFETAIYESGRCQMTGELVLRPSSRPDILVGDLVAYESCDGRQIYEAHQSVLARRDGGRLELESTLIRVLPSPDTYAPDNFLLVIVNSALMQGELRSADIAPATFRRRESLVS